MIKLLFWLAVITGTGILAAWVAENPGEVTMHWFDVRIDTSFAFLLLVSLVLALLLAWLYLLVRAIVNAPARFSEARGLKAYRKGLSEITYSVAALAAADSKTAEAHTKKAQKLLGTTPLTLLLSAQIARSQGDDTKTRLILERMLEHKETEYLAARSLSDAAGKQQLFGKALELAERAQAVNPKDASSATAVISLNLRSGEWQKALAAIGKAARKGVYATRSEMQRHKGLVHLTAGMHMIELGHAEMALAHVRPSLKLLPDFVPATVFAARTLSAVGKQTKAIKLILKQWKHTPHPELAHTLHDIIVRAPKEKQLKQMAVLTGLRPDSAESHLALAETAARHQEWETAKRSLKIALEKEETMEACKLMATVEQGESADFDAAGRWLARSADALPAPAWTCRACGHATNEWDTHCPSCNAFDTLEWKRREMKFVG